MLSHTTYRTPFPPNYLGSSNQFVSSRHLANLDDKIDTLGNQHHCNAHSHSLLLNTLPQTYPSINALTPPLIPLSHPATHPPFF